LARSAADLRLALQIIAGADGDYWEAPPVRLEAVALARPRIAWTDGFGGCPVTAGTRKALAGLASNLERVGWSVQPENPPLDFEQVWETFGQLLWCEIGSGMPPDAEAEWVQSLAGRREDPISRGLAGCQGATMRQFTATMTARDGIIATLEQFFKKYDVMLCPVTVGPAIRHCPQGSPVPVDERSVTYWMGGLAYTAPFNLTGNPAAVLPVALSAEGLPIGIQVVGRRWDDMRVLAVAEAIERLGLTAALHRPG
jgi:amidase